jgi:hypothetical protein
MPAAKQLLEHPKEGLDQPTQPIDLADQLCGKVEPIGGKPEESVASRAAAVGAALPMGCRRDRDHPSWMIGLDLLGRTTIKDHHLILDDTCNSVGVCQFEVLRNVINRVVTNSAAVAALFSNDRIP